VQGDLVVDDASRMGGRGGFMAAGPSGPLHVVADIPLPGPANRFDYQSVDPVRRQLYISHMSAGRLVVFDLDSSQVVNATDDEGAPTLA
jgi:hypothetical protein